MHTLSKIGDENAWPAITRSLLYDEDEEVARSAWRAAVVLVPAGEEDRLAAELAAQLGRGDRDVQLSLSRALVALGDVITPALEAGLASDDPAVRAHASATELLLRDPEAGFDLALEEATRRNVLGPDASAPSGWQDVLRIVELMHGLNSSSAARRQQIALAPAEDVPVSAELLARAILAESDPNVAGALRWALARAGGAGVASVASGAYSENADVRRRAVLAIAELAGDEATAVLADALGDSDPAVRGHAALALGKRGVTAAVPTLVAMVVAGTNDVEAGEVLGKLALDPGCANRIVIALVDELAADSAVRIRLTQALVEMPGTITQNVLRRLAHDDDRTVALIASAVVKHPRRATRS